jgi:hypothetical protein
MKPTVHPSTQFYKLNSLLRLIADCDNSFDKLEKIPNVYSGSITLMNVAASAITDTHQSNNLKIHISFRW